MSRILEVRGLSKTFIESDNMQVLYDVDMHVDKAEFVSIVGKSGCGKSTLLYILSTMDTMYEGEIILDGEKLSHRTQTELARIRNEKIGFVFQFHYLLNEFTALENVMLPAIKLNKFSKQEIENQAIERLKILDMHKEAHKKPNQLSGGQKQRVAIARALINSPKIIMADEPTGNLDQVNSEIVFGIFLELSTKFDQSLLVVTHDLEFASRTHRIIQMVDGRIV
ncbi:MAG: ABC transporter ATP-binding protein [Saprospiraceae bacterium]|nr:ABC transporter ATP-binding protein [Saprospiraceae bacterium]MBK9629709.1 ABC transporter ATP-binding protein [Saprospiraceae bacterium]